MSEIVERVAKAIELAGEKWADNHPFDYWDEAPLEVYARAAIEAMRDPTESMSTVGHKIDIMAIRNVSSIYQAMIDEALK